MSMLVITRGYIPTSQANSDGRYVGHGQPGPSLTGEGFDLPGKLWRGSVSDLDDFSDVESQGLRSGVSLDWFSWENLNRKPWFLP